MEHEASTNRAETAQTKRQRTQTRNMSSSPYTDIQGYKNKKTPETGALRLTISICHSESYKLRKKSHYVIIEIINW